MRIHFIAVGGAIMHQLAITMKRQGHEVTGSDDVIQEPSKGRLQKEGLFPNRLGFFADNISPNIDLVILGMHAKLDNPELAAAMENGVKVYSFPEFIYENSKNKKRIVIAGSHGKTSITSIIMHCLKKNKISFDYLVGSSVSGFEYSVQLTDAPFIIIEGDEYLASPINKEPKFIYYHAHLAILSGIEWDHINVFKTEEIYIQQFKKLIQSLESQAVLYYSNQDKIKNTIIDIRKDIRLEPYNAISHLVEGEVYYAQYDEEKIPLNLFGHHNMENLEAAYKICSELGISKRAFLYSISDFEGAGRRLEKMIEEENRVVYKDFAHSPSKLKATIAAAKEKYSDRKLIACFELHTFSSLTTEFLPQYKDSMNDSDIAIVYIDKDVVEKKGNQVFTEEQIKNGFGTKNIIYITDREKLEFQLSKYHDVSSVFLMMSS